MREAKNALRPWPPAAVSVMMGILLARSFRRPQPNCLTSAVDHAGWSAGRSGFTARSVSMAVKASNDSLPLTATLTPGTQEETQAAVQDAYRQSTPLYTIGGGTSLDYGLPARQPGL